MHLWRELLLLLCLITILGCFKPIEPYLSQYLVCLPEEAKSCCSGVESVTGCNSGCQSAYDEDLACMWIENGHNCAKWDCAALDDNAVNCNNTGYCYYENGHCKDSMCIGNFSEDEVNNSIYPVNAYAYLPALLLLGIFSSTSAAFAIVLGASARLLCRLLIALLPLFPSSVLAMQFAEATYALGYASEDGKHKHVSVVDVRRIKSITLSYSYSI